MRSHFSSCQPAIQVPGRCIAIRVVRHVDSLCGGYGHYEGDLVKVDVMDDRSPVEAGVAPSGLSVLGHGGGWL